MNVLWKLSWCLLLLLALYGPSLGQSSFLIGGTVHDTNGSKISKAHVAVLRSADGITMETTTDGEGEFRQEVPKSGDYELQVAAEGFKTLSATAVVSSSSPSIHVDLSLEPLKRSDAMRTSAGARTSPEVARSNRR